MHLSAGTFRKHRRQGPSTPQPTKRSGPGAQSVRTRSHPFIDGNGRTGRLFLNLVLVRLGYAPAIIYTRDRSKYLRTLRSADNGDAGPLGEMIVRSVTDNLYRFVVSAVAGPHRLVPLAALVHNEITEGALRVAANRGRLRAQIGQDGQWRSTRAWADDYIATRHRRPSA